MIMSHYFYYLTHLRDIFVRFLVQMKTSKFAFEINSPLVTVQKIELHEILTSLK